MQKPLKYSFIIPVFNRPDEIEELLETITKQTYDSDFEVVVVEDGSQISAEQVCLKYADKLHITYLAKPNTGPGDSRNYGMQKARYDYFIILDSDCLLPEHYLEAVDSYLQKHFVDCFGGADAAHTDFSDIQKAINFVMTSFLTTGGIRGSKKGVQRFEPRSFNMGLSRKGYEATNGFGKIHPGEDPDLVIRLWKKGFQTAFIEDAFVYHKRRISWEKFRKQVSKFGQTRPILNHWHPHTRKITFWLPALFSLGLIAALIGALWGCFAGLYLYGAYFILIAWHSTRVNRSLRIGLLSAWALLIQFFGYGFGFLYATFRLLFCRQSPEVLFPHLFFK
ncbi:glycosyltransferase [Capnocytophaga canimorsus]|uniref:glycosyltransferase n=1 Tax=Capnocytophaga canimorsus TaxID=28188 RepID=UPI000D6E7E4E|nr:glycosyltransferase [Capnocytophaga canimorsus]AWL78414.1 glycosyl transferase family 2 [Capnocytophaga canimorsus]AYW37037.1 glycosyltransferase [Capnocytophaga canimorsus]MDT9499760.1 glycosyltransferase [Capnocytophaga canimorsus]VEJ18997.1 Chondroitin polymerase [Capnocytophaga canimorsus]